MTAKDTWRDRARGMLFENLGLKIISILFALGLYAYIHGAENAQRTFAVPVVAVLPAEANRILMTQLPTEVAVTVRGSRTQLDDLRAEDMGSLRLDLQGHEQRIDLSPSMVHVSPGLLVEIVHPPFIALRWDDLVQKDLPVQIPRTGELGPGLATRATRAEPAAVLARGPRSVVDVMQVARAAPFDVTGLLEGQHRRKLKLEDPPKLVTYEPDSIEAVVEIVREQRALPLQKKVEVVGLPRATVTPASVRVTLRGTPEQISAVQPDSLIARVEPKAAGADTALPGNAYLPVLIDVPPNVQLVEVSPPKVLVKW